MFSVPRIAALRASTCNSKIRMTSSRSSDAGDDRMQKHEASEVAFSQTRLEDITHNYKNGDDAATSAPSGHVSENAEAYECASNVSLYAHMQSNVPEPFEAEGRSPTSLNMPGGGSNTAHKYLSGRRQSARDDK
ncbi:unnamed protein product [Ixodes hexagonus]